MRRLLAVMLLAFTPGIHAQGGPVPAVEALLKAIENSGCRMERNGQLHDAKAAAAHLRMKLENSGRVSMPAEQFIDRIASGSSISGTPYRVHCAGQPPVDSGAWLRARLVGIEPKR